MDARARPRPTGTARRRGIRIAGTVLVAAAAAAGAVASSSNLHEVDPGRFYRSGQLGGDALRDVVERHGIATIINLRGRDASARWWREESAVAHEFGVDLVDLAITSKRLPRREELLALLDALRDAERPILVHCDGGADRAGLVSALYQIEHMGRTREEALAMLSPRFLHLPFSAPSMRAFVAHYEGDAWARSSYRPCAADYARFPRRFCPERPAPGSGLR